MDSDPKQDSGQQGDSKKSDAVIDFLAEEVNSLYKYRDHYFENHKIEDAIHKIADIEKRKMEMLATFKENESKVFCDNKAKFNYLKGRLLNLGSSYSKEAEESLSKAIKLEPKFVEAWNELGDCYWKADALEKAINCFEGALKERPNKVSYRSLSMLARQETASSREQRMQNIEKGLMYAKEAVQLDPQDGLSWAVLGNAHLTSFFGVQQDPNTLKQCLKAYTQAEKDVVAKSMPDLHYNKATMLKYEEEFLLALESFTKASQYDPTWEAPRIKEKQLVKYLNEIKELASSHGKMKTKRLNQLLQSLDSRHLGPYNGGVYNSPTGYSVKLDEVPLAELQPGLNSEKVVLGKVVCSIHNEDTVPFTFCLVDKASTCVVVSVYNLSDGKGVIIGDSVAIPEPYVTDFNFTYKNVEYQFRLIRIETPLMLVVNSKKVSQDYLAGVRMSILNKCD